MKFIDNPDAPDIPPEIIAVQQGGHLVVLCGAGISMPLGFPSFQGLVDILYNELSEQQFPLEKEAYSSKAYDRVIELLEDRVGRDKVRKAIIRWFTSIDFEQADLAIYESLLAISSSKENKFQLVTTNIDPAFQALSKKIKLYIDNYPRLPPLTPPNWASAVHLHGVIDLERDPDGEFLILSEGDFGRAYMLDGRVVQAVKELFRNYTVLFVGYSLDDPLFRYITVAMAAERQANPDSYKQPYVLARADISTDQQKIAQWQSKGISPIPYYGNDHSTLHETLKAWANHIRDGLTSKESIINRYARENPTGMDQDDIKKVVETLQDQYGYPAKVFKELSPAAPIEWLPVLDEKGLLSVHITNEVIAPVSHAISFLIRPFENTFYLWEWLCNHLESNMLIHWVIDNGLVVHQGLKSLIRERIKGAMSPKEPYLTFWRIITSDNAIQTKNVEYISLPSTLESKESGAINPLISLIEPKFKLSKSLLYEGEWINGKAPYDVEVSIHLSDWSYVTLSKVAEYPKIYSPLLLEVTAALKRALDLWNFLDAKKANEFYDLSYLHIPSISPHPQNKRFESWTLLIEICRDLWEYEYKSNPSRARAILEIWKTIKYPTFRRLAFHAYTIGASEKPKEALTYLLEQDGRWLWERCVQREKYRLLVSIWPHLSNEETEDLMDIILAGPPNDKE